MQPTAAVDIGQPLRLIPSFGRQTTVDQRISSLKPRFAILPFLLLLWMALASYSAATQAPIKAARVGWMSRLGPAARDRNLEAFRLGMRELGYVEGQTFAMEPRYSDGRAERMPALAVELESAGVDIIGFDAAF